ncbi:SOS response-associated peptidase [Pontimicrobium sp. MEBiC01747]
MCYRISNTANKTAIEKTFNASFKYPKLHKKSPVIDGLTESSVAIITMLNKQQISLAIWGILPETYQDDWQHFQNVQNTLNVSLDVIKEDEKYAKALMHRRCIVIVTGFFTYYLHDGDLYPYYVHQESNEPFAIAGIFNELDDGFITCSLIVSKANSFIKKIHNSNILMPVVLDKFNREKWLDFNATEEIVTTVVNTAPQLAFKAHPIAKEFHKLGVDFDSALHPVNYNNIPKAM